jgi:dienelactone hydrolase
VHEWWGLNEYAKKRARMLAEAGYVAFAVDMFGDGKVTTHPEDAKAFVAEATKDPEVKKARFDAALEVLKKQPQVDAERIGVIGYASAAASRSTWRGQGGAEGARHIPRRPEALGKPAEKGTFEPRTVLVQTGGADPMVTKEQVKALEQEMKAAGVKLEVITYPGVKHGFTNPAADQAGMEGLAYDAKADRASWDAMLKYMKRVLGK